MDVEARSDDARASSRGCAAWGLEVLPCRRRRADVRAGRGLRAARGDGRCLVDPRSRDPRARVDRRRRRGHGGTHHRERHARQDHAEVARQGPERHETGLLVASHVAARAEASSAQVRFAERVGQASTLVVAARWEGLVRFLGDLRLVPRPRRAELGALRVQERAVVRGERRHDRLAAFSARGHGLSERHSGCRNPSR